MELTPCRNRDWDESGGMSRISSLTEVTGGASSSGREALEKIHSFIQKKTRARLKRGTPRLLEHRVCPKIRSSAPCERVVHLGFCGDNRRVVVSLPALGNVL